MIRDRRNDFSFERIRSDQLKVWRVYQGLLDAGVVEDQTGFGVLPAELCQYHAARERAWLISHAMPLLSVCARGGYKFFALTVVDPDGTVAAGRLDPALFEQRRRHVQRLMRSIKAPSVAIGFIEATFTTDHKSEYPEAWQLHEHIAVGIRAPRPKAERMLRVAFKVNPCPERGIHLPTTLTDLKERPRVAGWLKYGTKTLMFHSNVVRAAFYTRKGRSVVKQSYLKPSVRNELVRTLSMLPLPQRLILSGVRRVGQRLQLSSTGNDNMR